MQRVASSFSFQNERAIVSYVDNRKEVIPVGLVERLCPRVLLLPGLTFWPDLLAVNALPNRSQILVYQECQHTDRTLANPGLAEALAAVDIFAPNEGEALQLTGAATAEDALARLAQIVPMVIIKLGAQGAIAQRGKETARSPALAVHVVDTTGAGDSFNAGFLYGLLQDMSLQDCLRCGNIVGGLSTTAPGAQAVPDGATLARLLRP
ncbi:MAG: PfkB family carbohydrate kinase [Chloroflexota bacterium]|nr:PfkB family carbohydrate kinase [Chloroflexota bacterium]